MKWGKCTIARLLVLLSLPTFVACSAAAPEPVLPEKPTRSLGMAFRPGSCVAGANILPASMSVVGPDQRLRYLQPTDGKLQFALVLADGSELPIGFRWLEVPELGERMLLPPPPWNLELSFNSAHGGACLIHVEFHPSAEAVATGLRMAETTLVMAEPPPPPPPFVADPVTPSNQ
jgi:hypothetical protein